MSEYQYYEFQTIDRPLTEKEQAYIRTLSRRVSLTPTQAIFTYQYGDFPGDPKKVLEKYFDAMFYLANWGTKQLMFRLPRSVVSGEALKPYCFPRVISTSSTKDYVILDICFNEEEGGDWAEGEGELSILTELRHDLLRGDFRALYLAWLKAAELEGDETTGRGRFEPPVPAGLQNLSRPLRAFIKSFEIDDDLIAVASEASPERDEGFEQIDQSLAALSEEERNHFLVRVAKGEPNVDVELLRRLHEVSLSHHNMAATPSVQCRPSSVLLTAARERARLRKEQQRQESERKRVQKLDALAKKEDEVWEKVSTLISAKEPKAYDEAIAHLVELRKLAQHLGQFDRFHVRINKIHEAYRNRSGLLSRLQRAGLIKNSL